MKIFFNASVRGRGLYLANYQAIFEALKKTKNTVVTHAFESNPEKIAQETFEESRNFYEKLERSISLCDVAFFEVSYPSLGIGYEIARVVELGKPAVALHIADKIPFVLESVRKRREKLHIVEYRIENVEQVITETVSDVAEELDSRFTLILPSDISSHLKKMAKKGVNRSEYIRSLIKNDLKK